MTLDHKMLHALCFSMDRPMQLDGYLRSCRRHLRPCPVISVLFRATSDDLRAGYDEIARRHPDVGFMPETNFAGQLAQWLNQAGPLVVFGCDDVVFVRDVDVAGVTALLRVEKDVLACSLRLGDNIRFSHDAPDEVGRPAFQRVDDLLVWNWRQEKSHWHYAFELNGTIYHRGFLLSLFNGMETRRRQLPAADWRHPNLLELRGNEWLGRTEGAALMCCPLESALVVPTVNCVQNIFENPLQGAQQDVHALESRRRAGWELDLDAFDRQRYDRIHVGDFYLHRPRSTAAAPVPPVWHREARLPRPDLSIIMAAWQAERFIGQAVQSVLEQSGVDFELIVIDDASGDHTLATVMAVDDPRLTVGHLPQRLEAGAVRNLAIGKSKAPWICIFDADDIMMPLTLADYFKAVTAQSRPWAYCGLCLTDADNRDLKEYRRTPFDLLRMLERNIIPHPMAMYTRELFNRAGGYDAGLPRNEDHDLWLRCLFFEEPFFYDRLCVRYRRHGGSIGERHKNQCAIDPRARLDELVRQNPDYVRAPRSDLIRSALSLETAFTQGQWDAVLRAGMEYSAHGGAGFELDRRMITALAGLGRHQRALRMVTPWLRALSGGVMRMPQEITWVMAVGLDLMRMTGRKDELAALLPLARSILAQFRSADLQRALAAAETTCGSDA